MKRWQPVLVLLAILALWWWLDGAQQVHDSPDTTVDAEIASHGDGQARYYGKAAQTTARPTSSSRPSPDFLPREAHHTLDLILRGGPFPHRQDGAVFGNREKRLPSQPRGHYREYTVRTPGERDRGARRIVTGGDPPREFWYTADHYQTFRRFEVAP